MQAELEKWIADHWWCIVHEDEECDCSNGFVSTDDLRALLSRFVLCEKEPVAWLCRAIDGNVDATANPTVRDDYRRFKRSITNLYAPADIGTMRIVAIQGAAEEYARQGNTVIDNELWGKFGKERESIEAAIVALEDAACSTRSIVERWRYDGCIEQLRAMLPDS